MQLKLTRTTAFWVAASLFWTSSPGLIAKEVSPSWNEKGLGPAPSTLESADPEQIHQLIRERKARLAQEEYILRSLSDSLKNAQSWNGFVWTVSLPIDVAAFAAMAVGSFLLIRGAFGYAFAPMTEEGKHAKTLVRGLVFLTGGAAGSFVRQGILNLSSAEKRELEEKIRAAETSLKRNQEYLHDLERLIR
jgi:hypothetical protein